MASATTEFSVAAAVLTLGETTYCASDVTINTDAVGQHYTCMSSPVQSAIISGTKGWGGSATLAYDDTGDIDDLRDLAGAFSLVITTSNGQTVTITGNIVITGVDATFAHGELPSASVTFRGNGALLEVNS